MTKYLENKKVYLAGAIECSDDDGKSWRDEITLPLKNKFNLNVIHPSDKDTIFKLDHPKGECTEQVIALRENGNYDELVNMVKWIRHADLRLVDHSDFILCKLFSTIHTHGTWEELTIANRQKKPIIVWANMNKSEAPAWLFGMIPHETIFSEFDGVIEYLDDVNKGEIDKANKERWLL